MIALGPRIVNILMLTELSSCEEILKQVEQDQVRLDETIEILRRYKIIALRNFFERNRRVSEKDSGK